MTPKELFQRFQAWLEALEWTGTSNKIFGEAIWIVVEIPIMQLSRYPNPCGFIVDQGFVHHPEHPQIITQNFSLSVFVENIQSAFSESALVGACRTADTSSGAGILDLEKELLTQITKIDELVSQVFLVERSAPKPQKVSGANWPLALRPFVFQALCNLY